MPNLPVSLPAEPIARVGGWPARRCAWTHAPAARLALLAGALLALAVLSLRLGAVDVPFASVLAALRGESLDCGAQIVLFVRLPRLLGAVLAGSALAAAGCLLQAVLDNPIASPNLIGVNAGSGLFALIAAVFLPQALYLTPLFAFAGALLASLAVFLIGWRTGASRLTVILAGVAVSSLVAALSDTLLTLFPDAQASRTAFLIGGLAGVSMATVRAAAAPAILGLFVAIACSHDLNVLVLGEDMAAGLGLRVMRVRLLHLALASLLAASAVSIAGLVGFIGLIVPHLARRLFGHDHRLLVPASALAGAAFLLACDLLARTLFAPFELPVGIILAFLGAPFFLWLLMRRNGLARRWPADKASLAETEAANPADTAAAHPVMTSRPPVAKLELRQVSAGYHGQDILAGISLAVAPGAVTAILGRNGCGKTTLLRVLGRQLAARSGNVLLDGRAIGSYASRDLARHVSYLPQDLGAPPISVQALVALGRYPHLAFPHRLSPRDHEQIDRAMRTAGVWGMRHKPVRELSGGERQKACIAMALAQDAGIVLLDEPATHLDASCQRDVYRLVARLRDLGRTVVMVVHDLPAALTWADRICLLENGRVVVHDTAAAVCESGQIDRVFNVRCERQAGPDGRIHPIVT